MKTAVVSLAKLHDILTKHVGLEPEVIGAAGPASLGDLGVDSIGVIELEKVIFDEYGIDLPEQTQAMNIDQILDYVNTTARSDS